MKVQNNIILLKKLQASAEGQFSGETIIPGSDVQVVASFILLPLLDLTQDNLLVAVCVEDIKPVDPRFVDIFDINRHYNNNNSYYMNNNRYYNNDEDSNSYDNKNYNHYNKNKRRF